jgi:ketosteroid isomerase-like protein
MITAAIGRRALATLAALVLASPLVRAAPDAQDPAGAAADFYARMSARDLPGVRRYVPPTGFTEISPDGPTAHVLAPSAFQALFGSDLKIALRAEDLRVQRFGDAAIVTGTRVGTVGAKDALPSEARVPFTTVWTLEPDGWRLRHVHLSSSR